MTVSLLARRNGADGAGMSGAGRNAAADARDQPILAAVAGAGTEADRLVLPGGIERREVVGVRIGQREQRGDFVSFGFAAASATSARNTAS